MQRQGQAQGRGPKTSGQFTRQDKWMITIFTITAIAAIALFVAVLIMLLQFRSELAVEAQKRSRQSMEDRERENRTEEQRQRLITELDKKYEDLVQKMVRSELAVEAQNRSRQCMEDRERENRTEEQRQRQITELDQKYENLVQQMVRRELEVEAQNRSRQSMEDRERENRTEEQRQRLIADLDKKYEDLVQKMEMRDKEMNEVKRAVFKMMKEEILQAAGWYLASNGLAYKYKSEKKTFDDAEEDCNRNCSSLAASGIWNNSTRREIKENIFGSNPTDTWIGLHYNRSEGNWTWNDGTGEGIPWERGEPNNEGLVDGSCAHIWMTKAKSARNIVLADTGCRRKFAFLCEREIDSDFLCSEQ